AVRGRQRRGDHPDHAEPRRGRRGARPRVHRPRHEADAAVRRRGDGRSLADVPPRATRRGPLRPERDIYRGSDRDTDRHADPGVIAEPDGSAPRTPLLDVRDLHVESPTTRETVRAVNGTSFRVEPGETLAIVGESGSGKSVTSLAIRGRLPGGAQGSGCIRSRGGV